MEPTATKRQAGAPDSLADLLGGRRGAIDATLPPLAFVLGWLLSGESIWIGSAVALAVGLSIAVYRLAKGHRPRAVLLGMLGVCAAALVALYTGRAADFFLVQLLSNVASALAWAVSIVIGWPLLGVLVGAALGQRTRWRKDPALMRAYRLSSWVWVGQYLVRVVVFSSLWWIDAVIALGVSRVALSWPLVALSVAVSGWVLFRVLPGDHPGIRHPQVPEPSV
ncbi:hypothetical protein JOF53_003988 [Crossiella equi]|uniref:DUF3159 domain-containing protein n=1 Tax=Crossiella equi TaxID=130796 RepID=A0ABS5AFK7_9PSEU|nr:DUF3159 domain-containing protein [Crossiella equi]MBP2475116.1 hypothetical protein [Crossiella equi]